jgi:NADP-dependent 3-hydroxy acid dehydrogenase YdfG
LLFSRWRRLAEDGAKLTLGARRQASPNRTSRRASRVYAQYALPADAFANIVALAISQPDDVDINEILFRPTRQEM